MQGILENYKTQAEKFVKSGINKDIVADYLRKFKIIRDAKYKVAKESDIPTVTVPKGIARFDIDKYKSFEELETFVDYVLGQVNIAKHKGNKIEDIEIDAKPLIEKNGLQIYYAKDKHACIKYKGGGPYSWCVSRDDSSNMYNTYRFKHSEPAFYFVKDIEATKKEFSQPFNGSFINEWHFMVIQKTIHGEYIVTSAENKGDELMSWNDIVSVQPKLKGMEEYFQSVPLTTRERELYQKFENGIDDAEFKKLNYEDKSYYLDVAIPNNELSDSKFLDLPDDLKNKYISFGIELTDRMYVYVKTKKDLLKRFVEISLRVLDRYIVTASPIRQIGQNQLNAILNTQIGIDYVKNLQKTNDIILILLKEGHAAKVIELFDKDSILKSIGRDIIFRKYPAALFIYNDESNWPSIENFLGREKMTSLKIKDIGKAEQSTDTYYRSRKKQFNFLKLLLKYRSTFELQEILDVLIYNHDDEHILFYLDLYKNNKIIIENKDQLVKFLSDLILYDYTGNMISKIMSTLGYDILSKLDISVYTNLYSSVAKKNKNIANNIFLPILKKKIKTWYEVEHLKRFANISTTEAITLLGGPKEFKKNVKVNQYEVTNILYNARSDSEFKYLASSLNVSLITGSYGLDPILKNVDISVPLIFRYLGKQIIASHTDYNFLSFLTKLKETEPYTKKYNNRHEIFVDEYVKYGGLVNATSSYVVLAILEYCNPLKFVQYINAIGTDKISTYVNFDGLIIILTRKNISWKDVVSILGPTFAFKLVNIQSHDTSSISRLRNLITDAPQKVIDLLQYVNGNDLSDNKIYVLLSILPAGFHEKEYKINYLNKVIEAIGVTNIRNYILKNPEEILNRFIGYWLDRDVYIAAFINVLGVDYIKDFVTKRGYENSILKEDHEIYSQFFI
jgi:hypothetical protein